MCTVHHVPGFTLPFNISASILLACAAHVRSGHIILTGGLERGAMLPTPFTPRDPDGRDLEWAAWGAMDVLVATMRGVSQARCNCGDTVCVLCDTVHAR